MTSDIKEIVLKSTGAIGDLVIASALSAELNRLGYKTGIISRAFTLPLWNGLENVSTYPDEKAVPAGSQVVDISDYLKEFPHSRNLPVKYAGESNQRRGHLCEWMGYSLYAKSGISVHPSRDNVRVVLSPDEMQFGLKKLHEISGNKPVVILTPYSTTRNKNIPRKTLEEVVKGISGFSVPCLFEDPKNESNYIEGTTLVWEDLRNSAAIFYFSDAYVGVDSGPLHIANGVFQAHEPDRRKRVIAVLGSSDPDVVAYRDNRIISSTGQCQISPCGAHGYWPIERYGEEFGRAFYASGKEKDKSGCIFQDYAQCPTARCLEAISAEEIIEAVRGIVK